MEIQENLDIDAQDMAVMENSWVTQVLVIGAVVGALTGLGGAYLLIQRSKRKAEPPSLSTSEGLRLGLIIFGLLRQVAMLGDDDK
jgi:hypothetical protein